MRRSGAAPTRSTTNGTTIATTSAKPARAGAACAAPTRSPAAVRGPAGCAARTRSSRRRPASSLRLMRATSTSTTRKSTNCTSPVSFGKLKKSTWSKIPMTIAPSAARGNDIMPPIERGGQAEQQRVGADRGRARSSPGRVAERITAIADEEAGDRPDRGRHQLRADAGQPGEVGVRRRRAHRVAERGVAEQPPQPDRDDRHDDERRGAWRRAATVDVESRDATRRVIGVGNCVWSCPVR